MKARDDNGKLLYTQCDWCTRTVAPGGNIDGWTAGGSYYERQVTVEHHACPIHRDNILAGPETAAHLYPRDDEGQP